MDAALAFSIGEIKAKWVDILSFLSQRVEEIVEVAIKVLENQVKV
jgi:hypothetical protein